MKKFLSMFAVVATIMVSALALASCGGDDDNGSVTTVSTFKLAFEVNSGVKGSEEILNRLNKMAQEQLDTKSFDATDIQAKAFWSLFISESGPEIQKALDEAIDECGDKTLTFTAKLLKNGNTVFETKTWKYSKVI